MSNMNICIECSEEYDELRSSAEVPMDFCSNSCEQAYDMGSYEDEDAEDWND